MIMDTFDLLNSEIYLGEFVKLPKMAVFSMFVMISIINVIGRAMFFKKVGKTIWHALIPVYSIYEYFSVFWKGIYGILQFALSLLINLLLPTDVRLFKTGLTGTICILLFIARIILSSIAKIKLAKSFNRDSLFALCLMFMEPVFLIVLALDKSEYYGPTLREYNSEKLIDFKKILEFKQNRGNKKYMVNLYKWRSIIALLACVITLLTAIVAIAWNIVVFTRTSYLDDLLKYFTVDSNILTAVAAGSIIPFAIEGIRKKRFSYPKWANLLHYSGTICTTLTMTFTLTIISQFNPEMTFGSYNFFLHIICPIMILISFMLVESGYKLKPEDSAICLLPFATYATVYAIEVLLIGEENGGWEDIYMLVTYAPAFISFPLMFMIAIGVAAAIAKAYNYLEALRKEKLSRFWPKDATPVEIKIEAYGLGRYMGLHEDENSVTLPLDILRSMADNYGIKFEELTRAYTKGTIDGVEERNIYWQYRQKDLSSIFGTPYRLSKFCKEEEKASSLHAES